MPFSLLDLKEHNSELLKLLTTSLPDMLWVKDRDGKFIYVNEAVCTDLLMAKDIQEPIGKGDIFFALREREAHKDNPNWHTFGELCFNSDVVVIDNNKAMKFEEYGNVKGKLVYLEVYKAPFYDTDGKIIGTVGAGRDITELKKNQLDLERNLKVLDEQKKELEYQSNHDKLTDLPNRVFFMKELDDTINTAQKNKNKFSVLFIDLDNFKEINDSLGHIVGDLVLIEVTRRISVLMKEANILARLGGDEFGVICYGSMDEDALSQFIQTLSASLREPLYIGNNTLYTSMSMGISVFPNDGDSSTQILKNADVAMYKAKENGGNTYCYYDKEMTDKALERVFLETALRKALKEDELVVYFQPQIDTREDILVGMEVLVRWEHPELGIIPPDKFIPLAELTGMIVELDRIVMTKAISQFRKWQESGLNPGVLAINLAIKQIESDDFITFIRNLFESTGCSYEHIEFEVTESQIMNNPDKSIKVLNQIKDLGISISIDDFGTGYSSLAYLKRLPIHKLKIDKSFVDNLPDDAEDIAISKTIISLCKSLNLKVLAEGIETKEQKDFLLENGCSLVQGYLYARPLPIEEMTLFLQKQK